MVDGLIDKLESVSGLKNPADEDFPDLASMGAVVGQRDLFIEVGAMENHGATSAPHSHMPSANVLKTVGDALANPPAGTSPVAVHFDVGPTLGAVSSALSPPVPIATSLPGVLPPVVNGSKSSCIRGSPRRQER